MVCKKCGFDNPNGASFCVSCGARIDGKIACPNCGNMNDGSFVYCPTCGARTDGKTVCAKCGNAFEGQFCPACGSAAAQEVAVTATKRGSATAAKKEGVFERVCTHISAGAWLAAACFALIFVFLIGVIVEVNGVKVTASGTNFFYFFGDYFDELYDTKGLEVLENGAAARLTVLGVLPGVFGALIGAVTMICVVVFASITIYKFVVAYVKKRENDSKKWAIATIVSFLTGTVLFCMLNGGVTKLEGSKTKVVLDGGATAGVVLIAIFAVAALTFEVIRDFKANGAKGKIPALVWSVLGIVLTGVLLGLAQGVTFTMTSDAGSVGSGFSLWLYANNLIFVSAQDEMLAALRWMNILGTLAQIVTFVVGIFAALSLYEGLRNEDKRKKKGLIWAILALIGSILVLVFSFLMAVQYSELIETEVEFSVKMPIFCIVFSALVLVVAIARLSLASKQAKALDSNVG